MILTCPACTTRYRVAEREFEGAAGRTVRCANCGHLWYETAPGELAPAAGERATEAPAALAATRDEPALKTAEPEVPRLDVPPRSEAAPRQRAWGRLVGASWLIAIAVILVAVIAAGMLVRRHLPEVWPAAARLYASNSRAAEPAGSELVIRKIAPTRTADGLVIDGEIANLGGASRDVPRLRVALQDSVEKEIQLKIVDPPKAQLQPGEAVHFETPFVHPPDAATGVVVTFATP